MMKKTIAKLLLTLSMLAMTPSLSSCSFIFGGDEGYQIQDVQTATDEKGNVVLTITYTNETLAPLVVTLPAGMSGKNGVGIADVSSKIENNTLILTIKYDDTALEDTVLSFPILSGEDGKGISSVAVTQDENGNNILTFNYTDGTSSGPIVLPQAADGKDGVGIDTISSLLDSETGNYILTITYTDGREPTTIEIPPSENGTGVSFITFSEIQTDDDYYGLIVTYTDGTTSIVRIPRPQSTHWYYGDVAPSSTIGASGDYYLNTETGDVYNKTDSGWGNPLFSMKGTGAAEDKPLCTIYFDANGGTFDDGTNIRFLASLKVGANIPLEGENSFETIGIPNKEGFVFTGWYTSSQDESLSGQFTDLTPVYGDQLTLYAHWEIDG